MDIIISLYLRLWGEESSHSCNQSFFAMRHRLLSLASSLSSCSFFFDLNVPRPASLRSARSKLIRFEQCRPVLDLYLFDPNSANSSACWAGVVSGIRSTWPNMDHRCCFTLTDSGTTLHILYEASLEITLCGHRWLVMVRRCFLWQASSLSRNVCCPAVAVVQHEWHTGCII